MAVLGTVIQAARGVKFGGPSRYPCKPCKGSRAPLPPKDCLRVFGRYMEPLQGHTGLMLFYRCFM